MKLIDLSYYYSRGCSDPLAVMDRHAAAIQYVDHLPDGCQPVVVKFMDYEGHRTRGRVDYYFLTGGSSRFWTPHKAHRMLRELAPDVMILHGFLFPWQVMTLRQALGRKVKLLVQHHADVPGSLWMRALQKRADACVDGYLFAAPELAQPWLEKRVISDPARIFTTQGGSTTFIQKDRSLARQTTGVQGTPVFLWVGRLDANKDPLTALSAFRRYSAQCPQARLYMIYQDNELIKEVHGLLCEFQLQDRVTLVSKRPYSEMEDWYNSADYYLATSHSESYGFSLVEAMACGCTPVVTDIPSFRQITATGTAGFLFPPGNADSLYQQLCNLNPEAAAANRQAIAAYFREHLSFNAMARSIYTIGRQLSGVKAHELPG